MEEIHGAGGGGGKGGDSGSSRTPQEAPNTLQSAATARILDLLGEGPIVGLVDGLKSVYLDDTPLQNSNGSYNFQGVTVHARLGDANQSRIPGFPAIESEIDVGTQLKYSMPIVRSVSNPDVDAVRIKIRVPALTSQNVSNGDISGTSVAVIVEVLPDGDVWRQVGTIRISGKTTSPYDLAQRFNLPGNGPWSIRVTRASKDSDRSSLQNATYWTSFTEIIDARLTYPDSALIGLEVDARQFGSTIPKRSYDVKGRVIRVPSNYDPETRAYAGLWDGSFKLAWSDNPAWVYLDLATHARYGAGLEVVDKWSLYEIARYCDELVPDGYGGMEPRFAINTVLAEAVEAIDALNMLASAFRGMTYWGTNTAMAVADMPSDPVKLVTPANVIDGEFEYSGTSLRTRRSVAMVSWNDPADGYKKQVEVVEDADAIQKFGWRQVDVTAFGCTSRGQAARFGRWILYSERAETETVSYTAGIDHADLRPGDVIAVSDPSTAGARLGGRIRKTNSDYLEGYGDASLVLDFSDAIYAEAGTLPVSSVELDAVPDAVSGQDWYLDVMLPSGQIERRQVSGFAGNVVTLAEPLSAEPVTAAVWVLSSLSAEPRLFRVVSVSEQDGSRYQVTAAEHDPDKYLRVEQNLNLPERDTSLIPSGPLPAPVSISTGEYLYRSGVAVYSGATISVEPPNDARVTLYEYEVLRPGESDYAQLGTKSSVTVDLPDTTPGEYKIRVRSLSSTALRSPWREITVALQGLLLPPSDVTDLRISVNAGQLWLWWPAVPDLDLSHYEVRYSPTTEAARWANAQVVIDRVAAGTNSAVLPARKGTYLVKAVDTSGGYSQNAVSGTSEIAELNAYNAVELVDEAPAWGGVKTAVTATVAGLQLASAGTISGWSPLSAVLSMTSGGEYTPLPVEPAGPSLSLDFAGGAYSLDSEALSQMQPAGESSIGVAAEGFYDAAEVVDMGAVYTARITSELIASGYDLAGVIGSWATLAEIQQLDSADPDQWDVQMEVSRSITAATAAPSDWSDWSPLSIGEYTARAFRFRLRLQSFAKHVTPLVSAMRVTVDMPDRVADGRDLLCPAEGMRVSFDPAFMARPSLAVDAQGLAAGDRKYITNIDATGFDLQFLDQSGNGVARTFDYLAKGYGRRVA
jgi:predicted phage tail protein